MLKLNCCYWLLKHFYVTSWQSEALPATTQWPNKWNSCAHVAHFRPLLGSLGWCMANASFLRARALSSAPNEASPDLNPGLRCADPRTVRPPVAARMHWSTHPLNSSIITWQDICDSQICKTRVEFVCSNEKSNRHLESGQTWRQLNFIL